MKHFKQFKSHLRCTSNNPNSTASAKTFQLNVYVVLSVQTREGARMVCTPLSARVETKTDFLSQKYLRNNISVLVPMIKSESRAEKAPQQQSFEPAAHGSVSCQKSCGYKNNN